MLRIVNFIKVKTIEMSEKVEAYEYNVIVKGKCYCMNVVDTHFFLNELLYYKESEDLLIKLDSI